MGNSTQLYQIYGEKVIQLRPGIGVNKLKDIDSQKLPELNQ